jgi:hypothetical protein
MQFVALGPVFGVIIFLLVVAIATTAQPSRRSFRQSLRSFRPQRFFRYNALNLADPAQQLTAVMAARFEKRRVLSRAEYQVFKLVEKNVSSLRKGYRVLAQTSLGEILRSGSTDAFHSINSKRVDILVIDAGGWPVLAVEYQGTGHYLGTAAARDAIKREALRKAGVRYLEIDSTLDDGQVRARVQEALGLSAQSVATRHVEHAVA